MKDFELVKSFAKGKSILEKKIGNNAIIYTRVSSKDQMDNMSLDTQLKGCKHYAEKNDYVVKGCFGGTYESAKTDERKEFQRMVNFAKSSKEGISYILVYSLERFSRNENSIWLSSQLRKLGVSIVSVTQPIDVSNPTGVFQQKILFLFGEYDNELRRQKCISGMKEKLLRGEWVGTAPLGYSYDKNSKEQRIFINEKGKLIRKAFLLKINEGLSNTEISKRITQMGLRLSKQRLTELFRNPFYCGLLSHTFLEGEVVEGKHEKMITQEIFLTANDLVKKNVKGARQKKVDENLPLKKFVICGDCNTPFTGYLVKKKGKKIRNKAIPYYKCNKIGCKCNRSAVDMHEKFKQLLKNFQLDKRFIGPIKEQLEYTYHNLTESDGEDRRLIKSRLNEIDVKLEKVIERYACGEIDQNIYEKVKAKLNEEKLPIEEQLRNCEIKISNPSKLIEFALEYSSNLFNTWELGNVEEKMKLQKILFPEGIFFDRKNDHYRTGNINPIIELCNYLSDSCEGNKKGQSNMFLDLSCSVDRTRIEPNCT